MLSHKDEFSLSTGGKRPLQLKEKRKVAAFLAFFGMIVPSTRNYLRKPIKEFYYDHRQRRPSYSAN